MKRFVLCLVLLCTTLTPAQTRDPAALLRQAARLEAAKKWDAAAEAYGAAGDALIAAGRANEAAAALKKAAMMSEQAADALLKGPAAPTQAIPVQAPVAQTAPARNMPVAQTTVPPQQPFQTARQCLPGTPVKISPGPAAPSGAAAKIAAA